jgi:hypothetical protein
MLCHNDKCHSVWCVSIDLRKLCLQTYHLLSSAILGTVCFIHSVFSKGKINCKILNIHTKILHQQNKV